LTEKVFAHPTAEIAPGAAIGDGTQIWHHCHIRENSVIGTNCVLGRDVYVDYGVQIGNNVKIQNGVSVYQGVTLEDGVFCGPHCAFTNDLRPRAVTPDNILKTTDQWHFTPTLVQTGASIGAHATIVCGVTIGRWAMVGAGAVVTRDVPDHGLVYGTPARLTGFVCPCGHRLARAGSASDAAGAVMTCSSCGRRVDIGQDAVAQMVKEQSCAR
jgi:acetyltransferase-like isoleucine patch superfamily enzyme